MSVHIRCADSHNCLRLTLGRWWNTEVRFNMHSLGSPFLILSRTRHVGRRKLLEVLMDFTASYSCNLKMLGVLNSTFLFHFKTYWGCYITPSIPSSYSLAYIPQLHLASWTPGIWGWPRLCFSLLTHSKQLSLVTFCDTTAGIGKN